MSRRLHPTLADYAAIAINPVLVMGLVGSLIFLLLELFYQGAYPDRLRFSLAMYVLGTVLITRISVEDGWERAAPFGAALAVVVALALAKFVPNSFWAINWSLMGLCWWCVHRLTWDSTVFDESQPVESRGLLETVGLDPAARDAAADSAQLNDRQEVPRYAWLQLLTTQRKRPHAPGVWVVYFSLASLPIFGIGQAIIPTANLASRRYAFGLLVLYVACGLGLLLSTSFLTLRRYLRARRLEMPAVMAGNWLSTGGLMIAVLLLVAILLPRPNAEYEISRLPTRFSASDHSAAPAAVGQEGTRDAKAEQAPGRDHTPEESADQQPPPDGSGREPGANPPSQGGSAPGQQGSSGSGPKNSGAGQGGKQGGGDKSQSAAGQSNKPSQGDTQSQADKSKPPAEQDQRSKSSDAAQSSSPPPGRDPQSPKPPQEPEANSQQSSSAQPPPPSMSFEFSPGLLLLGLFKVVFYAAVLAALGYAVWRWHAQLQALIAHWVAQWRAFWDSFFGRSARKREPGAPGAAIPLRRATFADFADPFATGYARSSTPADLVKYTLAALEAWAFERSGARLPDQTVHEFARQIGGRWQPLATSTRALADLYARAIYSAQTVPAEKLGPLQQLWRQLATLDSVPPPAPIPPPPVR